MMLMLSIRKLSSVLHARFSLSTRRAHAGLFLLSFLALTGGIRAQDIDINFGAGAYEVMEDAGDITIQVFLTEPAPGTISVNYFTTDGTAIADTHYTPATGTLTFNPGDDRKTIKIPIIDDALTNQNRSFTISLDQSSIQHSLEGTNVWVGPGGEASITIIDDETPVFVSPAGQFSFSSLRYEVTYLEGAIRWTDNYRDTIGAVITVNRLNGSKGRVMVDWATTNLLVVDPDATNTVTDGFAIEGTDYTPMSGTLIFDHLQTSTNFIIPIRAGGGGPIGTNLADVQKIFGVNLSNPRPDPTENPELIKPTLAMTNAIVSIAQASASYVMFNRKFYRMDEYGANRSNSLTFAVLNPGRASGCVWLHVNLPRSYGFILAAGSDYTDGIERLEPQPYYTDGTTNIWNPQDYVPWSRQLDFANNEAEKIFTIVCLDDSRVEFNEDIYMWLTLQGCPPPPAPQRPPHPIAGDANVTILFDEEPAGAADREWNPANDVTTNPDFNQSPGANGEVLAVVVQPDGRQVIGGAFTAYNTHPRNRVTRILANGDIDPSFAVGTGANDYVMAMLQYPQDVPNTNDIGKIIIAGNFTAYNGTNVARIARLNSNGSLDMTFRPGNGANGPIRTVAIQKDGKLVVGGDFTVFNGEPRNHVARLNVDGSLDLSFDPGLGTDGTVWSIDIRDRTENIFSPRTAMGTELEDINIIDTGSGQGVISIEYDFLNIEDNIRVYYQGQLLFNRTMNGYGRLNVAYGPSNESAVKIVMNEGIGLPGTLWAYRVNVSPVVQERTIYLGGEFSTVGGAMRNGIARLKDNGSLDEAFDPRAGADNAVYAVAVQGDGRVLIGGAFTDVDFRSRNGIARLMRDGTLDTSYDPGTGFDDTVLSIAIQPEDGKATVGGYFKSFNQTRRIGLARLMQSGVLDTSFLDTGYNQFAGVIEPTSWAAANKVNAVVPYIVTNSTITFSSVLVTNTAGTVSTNLVPSSTNMVMSYYVMIGGSFTNLGGNVPFRQNDGYYWRAWTRQDKVTRFNVARLIGGYTLGPGNIQFFDPEYRADEFSNLKAIKMQRVDGSLGSIQATAAFTNRVAEGGIDYVDPGATTNLFYEFWGLTRSAGRVSPIWMTVNILNDDAVEADETLDIHSFDPVGSITLGGEYIPLGAARGISKAPLTIVDEDVNKGVITFFSPWYTVNENTNRAYITLVRTNGSEGRASVEFRTAPAPVDPAYGGQSWESEADYEPVAIRVEFAPGVTNRTVEIPIFTDNRVEVDEFISLVLTNAEGAALFGRSSNSTDIATLMIVDNDFLPGRLNFSSPTYETNEAAGFAVAAVNRVGGNVGSISVDVSVTAGTALEGVDFIPFSTNLVWYTGETAPKFIRIPLLQDLVVEDPKTINLSLLNVSTNGGIGATNTAIYNIVDDDSYGEFNFGKGSYEADELGTTLVIPVVRSKGTNGEVILNYSTADGTATAGADYASSSGTLQFLPGELSKTISVAVLDDTEPEGTESLTATLTTTATGIIGSQGQATIFIIDNERQRGPAGNIDDEFYGDGDYVGANRPIYAMVRQANGSLILGGDFTAINHVSTYRLARLLHTGLLDSSFDVGTGPNRAVRALALQPDERVIVGGFFTSINTTNRNYIARLTRDGRLDVSFNPGSGADNPVYAVGILADGRIAIGGAFTRYNAVLRPGIAVLNTNGTLSTSFNPGVGANGTVYALAIQPDQSIVIAGDFTTVQDVPRAGIARLLPDGRIDLTFNPGTGIAGAVRALALQRDGSVVAGGTFNVVNGFVRNNIVRFLSDGRVDETFVGGGNMPVYALALQADGKILVAGDFTVFNGLNRNRITRLNVDGRTDPSINFGTGANNFISTMLVQPNDGKIVIGGGFTKVDGMTREHLARLHGGSVAGPGAFEFGTPTYSVSEAEDFASIQVVRRGGLTNQVSVDVSTFPVTAQAGFDYLETARTLTFPEGENVLTIEVPMIDDQDVEEPETVMLAFENPVGAAIGDIPVATLTILSDDGHIAFETSRFAVNENDPGGYATIMVVRQGGTSSSATVDYFLAGGTATAGLDYQPVQGTLNFAPGQTFKQFLVPVIDDTLTEGVETVSLYLTNASGNASLGTQATSVLQIGDDELTNGELGFGAATYLVLEGQTNLVIPVFRTGGDKGIQSVSYTTEDITARAGADYRAAAGNLSFYDGETVKSITITIIPDLGKEPTETFLIRLFDVVGGATIGAQSNTVVTIMDDDIGPAGISIVASGVSITYENIPPGGNGQIDAGERIEAWFGLRNEGGTDALRIRSTLLETNGIIPQGTTSVDYPPLIGRGVTRSMQYSFIANGTNGQRIAATFRVFDGTNDLGLVSFPFTIGENQTRFTNYAAIIINDNTNASPYPSSITVANVPGRVSRVSVTLNSVSHTWAEDIDIMLVNPQGQRVMLMSDAGGSTEINRAVLTFTPDCQTPLPETNVIISGTYKPSNYSRGSADLFLPPAPQGEAGSNLNLLGGQSPNGVWSLYVMDDNPWDSGVIASGWSIEFGITDSGLPSADLQVTLTADSTEVFSGASLTYFVALTNGGPAIASNTMVRTSLPAEAIWLSGGTYDSGTHSVTFFYGDVQDCGYGEVRPISVRLKDNLPADALLVATAVATSTTVDEHYENNTATLRLGRGGAPTLAITAQTGTVTLSWPGSAGSPFVLYSCTDLRSGVWTPVPNAQPVYAGGNVKLTLPAPATGCVFYQLRQ